MSFNNTAARYEFALAREHVISPRFARTLRSGSPWAAALAQSAVGLVVISVYAITGYDPVVNLFYVGGGIGSLMIIGLLTLSAASVLAYFRRDAHQENAWHTTIAPAGALVALLVITFLAVTNFATLIGVDDSSPVPTGVFIGYAVLIALGIAHGLALRQFRPAVYAAIGRGAAPVREVPPAPDLADIASVDVEPQYPHPYRLPSNARLSGDLAPARESGDR